MKSKKFKYVLFAVVLASILIPINIASSSPLTEKKELKDKLVSQVISIREELDSIVEEYNVATEALEQTKAEIEELEALKDDSASRLSLYRKDLEVVLIDQYKHGKVQIAAVIAGTSNLSDFFSRVGLISRVGERYADLIQKVREAKDEYERTISKLNDRKLLEAQLVEEQRKKKEEIEKKIAEHEGLISQLKVDISVLEKAMYQPVGFISPNLFSGVVRLALEHQGEPYVWGAAGPDRFDCSGLVWYIFKQLGVKLPRSVAGQYKAGRPVPKDQLQSGDLVFFRNLGHVGIYIGNSQFVHAPHTGSYVRVESLNSPYRMRSYYGAVRIGG
jgi:cell wall-associated NlpC family hydrolase